MMDVVVGLVYVCVLVIVKDVFMLFDLCCFVWEWMIDWL